MEKIRQVFDRLDKWRWLPDYQLERRADLYFSLYLPDVLEEVLDVAIRPVVVPEFPIKQAESSRSDKVDYLAATADGTRLIFVELKTDCSSTRWEQFEYLCCGAQRSGAVLLEDLRAIRKASRAKIKYDALISAAKEMELTEDSTAKIVGNHTVVLISPSQEFRYRDEAVALFNEKAVSFHVVTFETFRTVVLKHSDPLSARFADSLNRWRNSSV